VQAILNVAFPIFGVILAGYLAGRFRVLGGDSTAALTVFVGARTVRTILWTAFSQAAAPALFVSSVSP